MKYLINEEKDKIIVTKSINRFLGIAFFILGSIFNLIFFSAYIMVFIGNVDTITFIGTTFIVTAYLPFIDILFIIGGGFIVGTFYFSFWTEGWKTKATLKENEKRIEFFSGIFFIKKKSYVHKNEINDLYIEKIPIDEMQSFFLYQVILKSKNIIKNTEFEKILIRGTDKNRIHSVGLKLIKLISIEEEMKYQTVERTILRKK